MRYKEFKEKIEDWGRKYNYETEVEIGGLKTYIKVKADKRSHIIASIGTRYQCIIDTDWNYPIKIKNHDRVELLNILVEFAATPIEERKDEKRFIIPLPWLVTSDNDQQYLTNKGGYFFASRRNKKLKQTWTENELNFIPDEYAKFAVEFDEEIEEKDDI